MKKFAIFTSSLVSIEQRIFITLEYKKRKELENLHNFSLKIRFSARLKELGPMKIKRTLVGFNLE